MSAGGLFALPVGARASVQVSPQSVQIRMQPSSIAVKMVPSAEERAVVLQEMLEKGVELLIGLRSGRVPRAAGQSDTFGPAEQLIHRHHVVQGQPARGVVFGAAGDHEGFGSFRAQRDSGNFDRPYELADTDQPDQY